MSTALEQSNELQQINWQSFVTSSNLNNKTGTDKDKWHWVKLCPRLAGSVLDGGKNSSSKCCQYLGVCAAFSGHCGRATVNAPSNYLLQLATAGTLSTFYVCVQYHVIVFSSTNGQFPSWYNSLRTMFSLVCGHSG